MAEKKYEEYGITDFQIHLFHEGTNYHAYQLMGAHPMDGGYRFVVYAPHAKQVSVVGDFNDWNGETHPMEKIGDTGIWWSFIEGLSAKEKYKYYIIGAQDQVIYKADPYARASSLRPETTSVLPVKSEYKWSDKAWMERRKKKEPYNNPMNIYEVHLGSWKQHEDGSFYTYEELADTLVPYVVDMGYTHIELMPVSEHPFDGSWGYQVSGYYAPTARHGDPEGLKKFIDKCHKLGIGVIMDWVPAHFPRDAFGLAKFDSEALYEYPDPRMGEHKEWGTLVFNFGKNEVKSFLISNAIYWLEEFHFDGLRVDAVSSMLYLDYNRKDGEWIANKDGGNCNYDVVELFQTLNKAVFSAFDNVLMIAEESTDWAKVTYPIEEGGLGFNFKWNMGWMNDSLTYMEMDPYFRSNNHHLLTFLLWYAFSENYILPLSHDEVVHGKKSLLDKMPGSYEEKFASLRMYYSFMMAHPGKKILFMGGEFGQFIEWRFYEGLEFSLLDYELHRDLHNYVKSLNKFYKDEKTLWGNDVNWDGFEWLVSDDNQNSVIAFTRKLKTKNICYVANFTPVKRDVYAIPVLESGIYEVVFSSSALEKDIPVVFESTKVEKGKFKHQIELVLPPLTAIFIKKTKALPRKTKAKEIDQASKSTKRIPTTKEVSSISQAKTKKVSTTKTEKKVKATPAKKTSSKKVDPTKVVATKKNSDTKVA